MEKTWKPTTAGILSIVAGAFGVIGGIRLAMIGTIVGRLLGVIPLPDLTSIILPALGGIIGALAAILLALGIVAIIGGIYALKRRKWGLALAGAICALLIPPPFALGILAIIFVAMGKREFE